MKSASAPVSSRRTFLTLALAAGASAGCRLQRPQLAQRSFGLSAPAAPPSVRPDEASGVLLVRPVQCAAAFDSQSFVVRRGESEYITDPYHRFLVSPGALLTGVISEWLRRAGTFRAVITLGSQVAPSHVLEVDAAQLYADYRVADQPKAVLGFTARLLHPLIGPPAQQIRWQREFGETVPLGRAGAEELVAGWNTALGTLLPLLGAELGRRPAPADGAQRGDSRA